MKLCVDLRIVRGFQAFLHCNNHEKWPLPTNHNSSHLVHVCLPSFVLFFSFSLSLLKHSDELWKQREQKLGSRNLGSDSFSRLPFFSVCSGGLVQIVTGIRMTAS